MCAYWLVPFLDHRVNAYAKYGCMLSIQGRVGAGIMRKMGASTSGTLRAMWWTIIVDYVRCPIIGCKRLRWTLTILGAYALAYALAPCMLWRMLYHSKGAF